MPYIGNPAVVGDSTNNFKLLDDIQSFTVTFDATDTSIVSISGNTLTFRNHRFLTGQRVTYNDGGGTAIGGLADGVYFIIKVDANTIQLATNASNAASSTAIDLTSGAAGGSHTLNVAFDGVNTKFSATHSSGTRAGVSRAGQISLSINGVIQQPQDTGSPTTGYGVLPDSIIIFSTPPASVDKVFGTFIGEVAASFDLTDNTVDNFTGDGSTSTFNLSRDVTSSNDVLVTLDGVTQYPTDSSTVRSYSVIESTLTFVSAPDTGVAIQVRHIGFAGATTSAVTGFYGRQGNVALKSTDDISVQNVSAGIITATKFVGVNSMTDLFVSGITSFTNATDSTSSTTGSVIVSGGVGIAGSLNVGGSVSVGGTLTYEDVTNIDAVGLITARAGVVVGSGITLSKDGDGFFTGIVTATDYKKADGSAVGGLSSDSDGNTIGGTNAGDSITTGTNNTVIGKDAGTAITTGTQNVAVGSLALDANTTGGNNTGLGYGSLGANTTASDNTAVGRNAMGTNSTGASNTAVGKAVMFGNTTGSNNSARYFNHYFGKYPNIIRKNRNGIAILNGQETKSQMEGLATDIIQYYGLGCRNVSKVYIPNDYNINFIFGGLYRYSKVIENAKYANNYDYNKAVFLMSDYTFLENGFFIIREDKGFSAPIACLHYEYYSSEIELEEHLNENRESIQCIISNMPIKRKIDFGSSQQPSLWDYADEIDTLSFLNNLH